METDATTVMERCRFYAKIGAKGGRLSRACGFGSLKVGLDGLTGLQRARNYGVITFPVRACGGSSAFQCLIPMQWYTPKKQDISRRVRHTADIALDVMAAVAIIGLLTLLILPQASKTLQAILWWMTGWI